MSIYKKQGEFLCLVTCDTNKELSAAKTSFMNVVKIYLASLRA